MLPLTHLSVSALSVFCLFSCDHGGCPPCYPRSLPSPGSTSFHPKKCLFSPPCHLGFPLCFLILASPHPNMLSDLKKKKIPPPRYFLPSSEPPRGPCWVLSPNPLFPLSVEMLQSGCCPHSIETSGIQIVKSNVQLSTFNFFAHERSLIRMNKSFT